jgi:hypothetical protein
MSEVVRWLIAGATIAVTVPLAAVGVGLGVVAGLLRRPTPPTALDEAQVLAQLQSIYDQITDVLAGCDCEDCEDLMAVAEATGVTERRLSPAEQAAWDSLRLRLGTDLPVDLWPEETP